MGSYETSLTASRDELYRALAAATAVGHTPRRRTAVDRLAQAARYTEPALIPVAAGVWLHNLAALVVR